MSHAKLKQSAPRCPSDELARYPEKTVQLASGATMVVRQAELPEIERLLRVIDPLRWVKEDGYDLVAAQVFADLVSWRAGRLRDPYCLLGVVDGELAGVVTGRAVESSRGASYHALALLRGLRIGALLLAAKMEHHFEVLGQQEVWIATDTPLGHQRWLAEYELEQRRPYHELERGACWVLSREVYLRSRSGLVTGTRPVPRALLERSRALRAPDLNELKSSAESEFEARL
ncbi:MAG: hypothetical protein CSA65_06890 [Proteobacteria bacterium]|nr:MAG: hypothetical protein CSA65_06890 [Pseudomonadota bacterium]